MRDWIKTMLAVTFLAAVVAGCGEGNVLPPELTREQAVAMFTEAYDTKYERPTYFSEDSVVIPCPDGDNDGYIRFTGTRVLEQTDTMDVAEIRSQLTYRECWVTTRERDDIKVAGSLADDMAFVIRYVPFPGGTASGTISGTLDWLFGVDEGSCEVSLAFEDQELPDDSRPLEAKYSGKLCDYDVEVVLDRHYE